MTPYEKMHEMHAALSYHHVREAAEAKITSYHFFNGKINPEDVLNKH